MTDFLDEKRKEIDARLRELRPLVDEFRRLEQAAAPQAGVGTTGRAVRSGGRRRGSAARKPGSGNGRRGRPRGSGTRAKEALELVQANPGIKISEMAGRMNIKANYLYRVMPTLEGEGKVKKQDGGWHPA